MQSWNAVVISTADAAAGYPVEIVNPAFCSMTGYSFEEVKGRSLKMLQGPETDPEVIEELRNCLRQERYFEGMTVNYRKDRSSYTVRWNISPVRDERGVVTHFVSVQRDMSESIEAERQNRLLARALDASGAAIFLTDADFNIIFANKALKDITGYSVEELVDRTPALLRSGHHDEAFYANLHEAISRGQEFRSTFVNRRRDGSTYHAEQTISPITDDKGRITHYVSISKDISEHILRENSLREAATTDGLTGLHNRSYVEGRLEQACRHSTQHHAPLTVLMCDVDHFKQVNDRYGHLTGDRILQRVARILRKAVRASDVIGRWGGEEFLIVLENCNEQCALELAERIRRLVEMCQDAEVGRVTLSLGIAMMAPGESVTALVARADAAMYEAKRSGRNRLSTSSPVSPTGDPDSN